MRGTRLYVLLTVVMLAALGAASFAVADNGGAKKMRGQLHGYEEVPSVSTSGHGSFRADINRETNTITFELRYADLSGPASAAHIHFGQRGVNGGVSAFLCGGSTKPACPAGNSATITGTIAAADVVGPAAQGIAPTEIAELIRAIRAGKTYANVHTTAFPGGEIRAQLNNRNRR